MKLDKRMKAIKSCVAFLLLISCGSIAGAPFPFSKWGWDSSEKKIIDKNYLLLSGVVIGTTTLNEVEGIFGTSEIYKLDKKNYSPNLLCYKSEDDDTGVIFQSGPLGGWKVVTAIWIGKVDFIDEARCAKSTLVDRKKMAVKGLSLDLGISDVKNIIGKPTFHDSSFFAYRYEDKIALEKNKIFDVSSGFEFESGQSQLNWFRIYRQLSN